MLPFLKRKDKTASSGVSIKTLIPDNTVEETPDFIKEIAKELILAIHSFNAEATATALKALFEVSELEPHEEAPHTYESQNIKAGIE